MQLSLFFLPLQVNLGAEHRAILHPVGHSADRQAPGA
jgi:hypothetical protein